VDSPAHRGYDREEAELSPAAVLMEDEVGIAPVEDVVDGDPQLVCHLLPSPEEGIAEI